MVWWLMEKKNERINRILEVIQENQVTTTRYLSDLFHVSEMTIRRDINMLEKQDLVKVFFGGISLNSTAKETHKAKSYDLEQEISLYVNEKKLIAEKAASLIEPNDAIMIDAGSTTGQIVDYIPAYSNLMIYSHSLHILNRVCERDNIKVIGCCGYYHRNTQVFESEEGTQLIAKARINKAFMSARGVSEYGITTAETYELNMKRAVMKASEQKILLADSSKIGKTWYAQYAQLTEFDVIITDSGIKDEYMKLFDNQKIKVYIV